MGRIAVVILSLGGSTMRLIASCAALAAFCSFARPAGAQRDVPFRNDIPVAPTGIAVPPLPSEPVVYHTAEGQDIRVVVLTRGLKRPWSLAFLPSGEMLVT